MKTKKVYPFLNAALYVTGDEMMFDAREVEGYVVRNKDANGMALSVEVWMKSGRTMLLSAMVDEEVYPGENLVTLIDSVHYSHFWHDNEDSSPSDED